MQNKLLKIAVMAGLAGGLGCFAYFLFLYLNHFPSLITKKEISISFNVLAMLGAVWYYSRQKQQSLHLWEGLSLSYLTNFIAALTNATLIYLLMTQTQNEVLAQLMNESHQLLEITKADITRLQGENGYKQLVESVKLITPGSLFWDEIIKKMLYGILPALLISMYFRRVSYAR
ncbi:MAG: DUF4199 domain-containing protein [Spirosomataceae bacterium]